VTPRDSRDSDLGGGRQKPKRHRVTHDTTTGRGDKDLSPGDKDDKPTPQANESSYAAAPATQSEFAHDAENSHRAPTVEPLLADAAAREREPLNVKIEFVVVDGTAAEELIRRQAAAVRDALQWFADHRPR
jgi:hypothetical protein